VIFAREALRSNQRDQERYGLLERIGERLASSLELNQTLRRVADTLVPQFADHCSSTCSPKTCWSAGPCGTPVVGPRHQARSPT